MDIIKQIEKDEGKTLEFKEKISSGALPNAITVEEILRGRSDIRNKIIARIFKEADTIEQ
jgi:predicted HTH transcriptional regulator